MIDEETRREITRIEREFGAQMTAQERAVGKINGQVTTLEGTIETVRESVAKYCTTGSSQSIEGFATEMRLRVKMLEEGNRDRRALWFSIAGLALGALGFLMNLFKMMKGG